MTVRKLSVDLEELIEAMDQIERDINEWYLDTQTGEVLLVGSEALREMDCDEELLEGETEGEHRVPDWQQAERELAARIAQDEVDRYRRIPGNASSEGYRLMERFAARVRDPALQEKLEIALDGKGAFRRFKNVLYDYPDERRRWFDYERECKLEWARKWLESLEIESTWESPARS